jgi:hypothetical protein
VSAQENLVNGNLIMINDNGGWCWYQDERSVFDATTGQVVCVSVGETGGIGGSAADGDLDVTSFDINTGERTTFLLRNAYNSDDHCEPAIWQRPDGRYIVAYNKHNDSSGATRFRISTNPNDVSAWQPEFSFDWNAATGETISSTYNNLLYMSAEGTGMGRLYNFTRHMERSPIISYSDDWGETWNYLNALTLPVDSRGYSNGYIKFTSNGVDRIDFIVTEGHPRNYNTSIYHGYVSDGQTFDSSGETIAELYDLPRMPPPETYTPVFVSSPEDGVNDENEYHRAWTTELQCDSEGNIHGLFTTRYGTEVDPNLPSNKRVPGDADHRLFYARLDAATLQWSVTELGKMGGPLYSSEQDYTGLGAIDPRDPSTIYISTPFDPRTSVQTDHREIYKGITSDLGETWQWTPITENSTVDNLRPIIPTGNDDSTAEGYRPSSSR